MGVNVERVIVATFVIGGLLAGAGGFLYAMTFNASYTMGFIPGIKAFTAAVCVRSRDPARPGPGPPNAEAPGPPTDSPACYGMAVRRPSASAAAARRLS
jgi:hypothetical protein